MGAQVDFIRKEIEYIVRNKWWAKMGGPSWKEEDRLGYKGNVGRDS